MKTTNSSLYFSLFVETYDKENVGCITANI